MQSNPTHIIIKPEATGEIHYSQKNTLPPLILRYNRKFQSCRALLSAIYYRSSIRSVPCPNLGLVPSMTPFTIYSKHILPSETSSLLYLGLIFSISVVIYLQIPSLFQNALANLQIFPLHIGYLFTDSVSASRHLFSRLVSSTPHES